MQTKNQEVLDWIADGHIVRGREREAMRLAGMFPDAQEWRWFADQLLLWLAVILSGAALVFFLAYNWDDMGRYAKFALAEIALVLSLLACWRYDSASLAGKASLLLASLFVGALLALVGQIYQTGADTYELFAVWAVAIAGWVALARMPALWLMWLLLLDLALMLYLKTFGGIWGWAFSERRQLWLFFLFNTLAWAMWEMLGLYWLKQNRSAWAVRVLAVLSGTLVTILAFDAIFINFLHHSALQLSSRVAAGVAYLLWLGAVFWVFWHKIPDLFVLAGAVLSLIIVFNAWVAKNILHHSDAGGFLLVGCLLIASSALGGMLLKKIAKEFSHA